MFVINGVDYTLYVIGFLVTVFFFFAQLHLLFRCKRWFCKLWCIIFLAIVGVLTLLMYVGVFGQGSGFLPGNILAALLMLIFMAFVAAGIVLAYIFYYLYKKLCYKK